jgi:hypothetical protein
MCVSCETGAQSEREFGLKVTDLTGYQSQSRNTQNLPVHPTIELVYVLGMASRNHNPRPLMKPLAFALTYNTDAKI